MSSKRRSICEVKHLLIQIVAFVLGGLVLSSCNFVEHLTPKGAANVDSSVSVDRSQLSFQQVSQKVFTTNCVSCHNGATQSGGVDLTNYASVKAKMEAIHDVLLAKSMPPASRAQLTSSQASLLNSWIAAGAPEVAVGSAPDPVPPPPAVVPADPVKPNFTSLKKHIFNTQCIICHSPGNSASSLPLADLEKVLKMREGLVIPFHPEKSLLLQAINGQGDKPMPPVKSKRVLKKEDIAMIQKWIELGAPEYETPDTKPVVYSLINFTKVYEDVFIPRCVRCHGGPNPDKGRNFETYAGIQASLQDILFVALVEKTMPPKTHLSATESDELSEWIKRGAPEETEVLPPNSGVTLTEAPATLASVKQLIFESRCYGCHASGEKADRVPLDVAANFLNGADPLVIPGDTTDKSRLIQVITQTGKKRMPPLSEGAALSDDQVSLIRRWIAGGAKE